MRSVLIGLVLLFLLLQYQLWFSGSGIRKTLSMKTHIEQQQQQNKQLSVRNQAVAADIKDLRQGNEAVEERARNELGMVKKGETFYRTVHH